MAGTGAAAGPAGGVAVGSARGAGAAEAPTTPVDPRPVVLGASAWAAAWVATSGDRSQWLGAGLAMAAAAILARRWRRWGLGGAALLAAACLVLGIARTEQLATGPLADLARQGAVVEVDAVLQGGARTFEARATRPAAWVSGARLVAVAGRGGAWRSGAPVELSATGEEAAAWARLEPGTAVRATVRLSAPDAGEGLAALARARGRPQLLAPPGPVDAAVARVRAGLRQASAGLAPDARALVPALVVGDTSELPDDLVDRFKTTGLTHLTAVSGANLVLLLAFVRLVAVRLGARGGVLRAVLAVTVLAFVALCLAEPSVVRAAAMGVVGLAAVGAGGRGRQGLRYLGVAVLGLVLWDPWIARSIGFCLSVGASAGLLWWAGRWTEVLARWLPGWCAEAVAVPLAAQLATQPIVTAISGQVSVVGLLANAVAGPLVGPATVCGFLGAGVSVLSVPIAALIVWPAGWCAQGLAWIARLGDALPGASTAWPATPWGIALVAAACLLLGYLAPLLFERRWLSVAVAIVLVLALARTPVPVGWPPAAWSVVSCDVGQGDATVIRAGPRSAVVVDAGPEPRALARCLDQLGVDTVPLVVLTHLHADHANGLPALAGRRVSLVVTSGVRTPASGEARVDALEAAGARHAVAAAGSAWTVGAARVEVLASAGLADSVESAEGGESSAENDASLLLRVSVDGLSLLLAGDTEDTGQERLLGLGAAVDVDVLLVPHHGSSRQSAAFLGLTTPEIALVSVGANNDYGHPTAKTLKVVGALTPNVVRTDLHGAVAVARVAGRLQVTTQR